MNHIKEDSKLHVIYRQESWGVANGRGSFAAYIHIGIKMCRTDSQSFSASNILHITYRTTTGDRNRKPHES